VSKEEEEDTRNELQEGYLSNLLRQLGVIVTRGKKALLLQFPQVLRGREPLPRNVGVGFVAYRLVNDRLQRQALRLLRGQAPENVHNQAFGGRVENLVRA